MTRAEKIEIAIRKILQLRDKGFLPRNFDLKEIYFGSYKYDGLVIRGSGGQSRFVWEEAPNGLMKATAYDFCSPFSMPVNPYQSQLTFNLFEKDL